MTQYQLNGKTLGVVEVEHDNPFHINVRNTTLWYRYFDNEKVRQFTGVELNDHAFNFFSLSKNITEEQASTIMPGLSTGQLDGVWYSIGKGERYCFDNAVDAFNSWLKANSIKGNSVILIKDK